MKRLMLVLMLLVVVAFTLAPAFAQEQEPAGLDDYFQKLVLQRDSANQPGITPQAGPAGNSIYQVFVSDSVGTYSARTGPGHPVPGQNVLYGGASGSTGTTFNTIRSYTSGTNYTQVSGRTTEPGYTNVALAPYKQSVTPIGATGFRFTYLLPGPAGTPASADHLQIVQDINVIGTDISNSRIAVTTQITNLGTTPVSLGIRYLWDYQIAGDDGPSFTRVNPDVPAIVNETTFAPPDFDFYQIEDNNSASSPLFSVSGSALGPSGLGPSSSDSILFACWPNSVGTAFNYSTTNLNCSTGGGDTAVLYYAGQTANSALVVNPGAQTTYSQYLFAIPPGPNTPPDAVDDEATTVFPSAVNIAVLLNDIDLDGDALTITNISTPGYGTVVINPANGELTYTPLTESPTGIDTFTYTISDGTTTDTATVTIRFQDDNQPPVAVDDTATTNISTAVGIAVLANDTDADGDMLSVTALTTPTVGTAAINPDGTVTYTPPAGFVGNATFEYTVSDGTDTDIGLVTVTMINRLPEANDDTATTFVNTLVNIPVIANDTDADLQPLSVSAIGTPSSGTAVLNGTTSIDYTPAPGFMGVATFTYTAFDGYDSDTATVTVNVLNRAPEAADDTAETPVNTPVTINVLANDIDPDGHPLTVPTVSPASSGVAVINPDNTVTYTPNPGFIGTDSFFYVVTDNMEIATATVTVNVIEVCTEADRNPELDLDHEESRLLPESGYRTGVIINRSTRCSYEVGIASYRMFDNVIDNQELFDSEVVTIPPGGRLELTVDLPDCATQVDLFYGPLLPNLIGQRYGERLIEGIQLGTPNYCTRPAP
ncbi:MAG: Ig-like domain-containing protein [bacterium]|nr:Ig-like domain-containing protein [bacterium]